MRMEDKIRDALQEAFAPERLEVVNESYKHAGHAGDDGSGESHFHVAITAAAFADQSRLARHRAVHAALGTEIMAQIHALSLEINA